MKIAALALVATLFVFPLFVGLGASDFQNDEAIYAYSVDKMLERGEWLTPISIPHEDAPFLEKPPLKFWIVASAIRAGLLPHDEFGMRFWDALFGGIAFFYVFAIGWKLGGPLAAFSSVLMLFVHGPLIFEHGLRSHNMEAALVLSYCGGMYHFLQWAGAGRRQRLHVFALAGYFILGFMTKFVAALFLPLVTAMLTLPSRRLRARLMDEWKTWAGAAMVTVALVVPWFVYEYAKYGRHLFEVMFEIHVVKRFTDHLDPNHLASTSFYATTMIHHLREDGTLFVCLGGLVLLAWMAVRRRRLEAIAVLTWLFVPLATLSLFSSKLYHYAYPFVPPVALAGGYATAVIALFARGAVRRVAGATKAAATASETETGQVAGTGAGNLSASRGWKLAEKAALVAVIVAILPFSAYWKALSDLPDGRHPLRSARDCLKAAGLRHPLDGQPPGVWAEGEGFSHSYYYYFRDLGPYVERDFASDATVYVHLYAPWHYRTVLLSYDRYVQFTSLLEARDQVMIELAARKVSLDPSILAAAPEHTPVGKIEFPGEVVLLPGPLSYCAEIAQR